MRVKIHGPNLPPAQSCKGELHVHQAECADNQRYHDDVPPWEIAAETRREVVENIYPPEDFGYNPFDPSDRSAYDDDVYFAPCTANLFS